MSSVKFMSGVEGPAAGRRAWLGGRTDLARGYGPCVLPFHHLWFQGGDACGDAGGYDYVRGGFSAVASRRDGERGEEPRGAALIEGALI